jgi:phage I-like protein
MNEKLIQSFMKNLGITREEAIELIADDEKIDSGEKLFELTDEQKKNSKKARQVARGVATKPVKRERKADNDKRELIELIKSTIAAVDTDVNVTNIEREIIFHFHNRKFKIILSAPRS